jgi:hypothetical protein
MLLAINIGTAIAFGKLEVKRSQSVVIMILKFTILLFIIAILAMIINSNFKILLGIYELRYYFIMLFLCFSLYIYKPLPLTPVAFDKTIVLIALAQIPVTILQHYLVISGRVHLTNTPLDMASGTFTSYPALVYIQLLAVGLLLDKQLRTRIPLMRINNYLLIIFLQIPLLISYSRAAMAFMILMCIFVYFCYYISHLSFVEITRNITLMTCLSVVLVFMFYKFFWEYHGLESQLEPRFLIEYVFRPPKSYEEYIMGYHAVMGRGRAVTESVRLISGSVGTFLVGLGSGSVSEASFLGLEGSYFAAFGSLAGLGRTQVSKVLAEGGILGMLVVVWFFLEFFRHGRRAGETEPKDERGNGYLVIIIGTLMLFWYSPILMSYIAVFVLAYFAACLQAAYDGVRDDYVCR